MLHDGEGEAFTADFSHPGWGMTVPPLGASVLAVGPGPPHPRRCEVWNPGREERSEGGGGSERRGRGGRRAGLTAGATPRTAEASRGPSLDAAALFLTRFLRPVFSLRAATVPEVKVRLFSEHCFVRLFSPSGASVTAWGTEVTVPGGGARRASLEAGVTTPGTWPGAGVSASCPMPGAEPCPTPHVRSGHCGTRETRNGPGRTGSD